MARFYTPLSEARRNRGYYLLPLILILPFCPLPSVLCLSQIIYFLDGEGVCLDGEEVEEVEPPLRAGVSTKPNSNNC